MSKMATTMDEGMKKANDVTDTAKPFSASFAAAAAHNPPGDARDMVENSASKKPVDKKMDTGKSGKVPSDQQSSDTPVANAPAVSTPSNLMAFTLQYGGNAGAEDKTVAATKQAEGSSKVPSAKDGDGSSSSTSDRGAVQSAPATPIRAAVPPAGPAGSSAGTPGTTTSDPADHGSSSQPDQASDGPALGNTAILSDGNTSVAAGSNATALPVPAISSVAGSFPLIPNAVPQAMATEGPADIRVDGLGQNEQPGIRPAGAVSGTPAAAKKSSSQDASNLPSSDALPSVSVKPHETVPEPQQAADLTLQQATHGAIVSSPAPHSGPSDAQADASATANQVPSSTPRPAESGPQWSSAAQPVVHSAQLIQAMHGSEMRMGMNSAEFGNISITASVNHQTLSAQISLDHAALGHALTAQLSGMEAKLGSAYGLQSRVEVRNGSSGAQAGSGDRQSDQPGTNGSRPVMGIKAAAQAAELISVPANIMPVSSTRLDVLI